MADSYFSDPLVDEVHETREKLLAECGGDLERLMDRLQSREEDDRARIVREAKDLKAPAGQRS